MKNFRNEWKYCISSAAALELQAKLLAVMDTDQHAEMDGCYRVRSLYFDNIDNACARENIAGESRRFKYRIRYYGNDSGFLCLERKEKFNSLCHKDSCIISKDEYDALLRGAYDKVIWEDERRLLTRFAVDMASEYYTPKSVVDYERKALVEPISNVRITFDRNLFVSSDIYKFLSGDYNKIPAIDHGLNILEVKYDDILPGYISRILKTVHMNQQAFSKYYNSRILTTDYYEVV